MQPRISTVQCLVCDISAGAIYHTEINAALRHHFHPLQLPKIPRATLISLLTSLPASTVVASSPPLSRPLRTVPTPYHSSCTSLHSTLASSLSHPVNSHQFPPSPKTPPLSFARIWRRCAAAFFRRSRRCPDCSRARGVFGLPPVGPTLMCPVPVQRPRSTEKVPVCSSRSSPGKTPSKCPTPASKIHGSGR